MHSPTQSTAIPKLNQLRSSPNATETLLQEVLGLLVQLLAAKDVCGDLSPDVPGVEPAVEEAGSASVLQAKNPEWFTNHLMYIARPYSIDILNGLQIISNIYQWTL
ncbi:hypothetical protein E4T56_gene19276 [Termitomyces sp. T112]|nr:hypothetical protein E4T56_gene19276 [Termitomyces sp. T112]